MRSLFVAFILCTAASIFSHIHANQWLSSSNEKVVVYILNKKCCYLYTEPLKTETLCWTAEQALQDCKPLSIALCCSNYTQLSQVTSGER